MQYSCIIRFANYYQIFVFTNLQLSWINFLFKRYIINFIKITRMLLLLTFRMIDFNYLIFFLFLWSKQNSQILIYVFSHAYKLCSGREGCVCVIILTNTIFYFYFLFLNHFIIQFLFCIKRNLYIYIFLLFHILKHFIIFIKSWK